MQRVRQMSHATEIQINTERQTSIEKWRQTNIPKNIFKGYIEIEADIFLGKKNNPSFLLE